VPLLLDGKPVGVIAVARADVGPFPEREIALLQTFADQAVIAIGNVRLFDAEQQRTRELAESLEQQTAASEVLRVHLKLARGPAARVRGHPDERDAALQGEIRHTAPV